METLEESDKNLADADEEPMLMTSTRPFQDQANSSPNAKLLVLFVFLMHYTILQSSLLPNKHILLSGSIGLQAFCKVIKEHDKDTPRRDSQIIIDRGTFVEHWLNFCESDALKGMPRLRYFQIFLPPTILNH